MQLQLKTALAYEIICGLDKIAELPHEKDSKTTKVTIKRAIWQIKIQWMLVVKTEGTPQWILTHFDKCQILIFAGIFSNSNKIPKPFP